ncbi:hypothetical protein ABKV19_025987, partial [Rosa sericea]
IWRMKLENWGKEEELQVWMPKIVDPKTGEERHVTIYVDDGIRPNANMTDLAKLKPAFKSDGTTTAGISSLKYQWERKANHYTMENVDVVRAE